MPIESAYTQEAEVTMEDVHAWGEANHMKPSGDNVKDLAAVNRMRSLLKLPPFTIINGGRKILQQAQQVARATTVPKTIGGPAAVSKRLRDILFAELEDLRAGKSNPQQASAVAKVAHQIIAATRMESELERIEPPTIDGMVER
jgi:hypothetical protein